MYDKEEMEKFMDYMNSELYRGGKSTAYCRQIILNMLMMNLIVTNKSLKDVQYDLDGLLKEARQAAVKQFLFKDKMEAKFKLEKIN